ncbi:MAG TPA: ECF transporter S component [Firmicutes bacterium]|nr:ECF transporter S component [Bacillota bacterium]
MNTTFTTRKLTTMGLLAAISIILVWMIHFPIFPATAFLEYDPADIPIIFATFLYGPLSGFLLTVITSVIQGVTVSAGSGIYGIIMHILATGCYVLVAGLIYSKWKTLKGMIFALICGTLCATAVMGVANIFITPIFMSVPTDAVIALLWPFIIPFNLIKISVNSVFSAVLFKALERIPLLKHNHI